MSETSEYQLRNAVTDDDMGNYVFGGVPQNGDQITIDEKRYIIQRVWDTSGLLYLELVVLHRGVVPC